MKINLNDASTLRKIAMLALTDNKVVGLLGGKILGAVLGGESIGGGNKQIQWVSPEGVTHAIGTGNLNKAFVKSSNKGIGRGGNELKAGDKFVHLDVDVDNNTIDVNFFSEDDVRKF